MSEWSFGFLFPDLVSKILTFSARNTSGTNSEDKMGDCGPTIDMACRDVLLSKRLKGAAIATILTASALGVLLPLLGRNLRFLRTDGNLFFISKAFAAGVILATAFVHMLPSAESTLANPCLPAHPWSKFAWAGFIAMLASLGTLVVDFAATEFYQKRHLHNATLDKVVDASGEAAGLAKGDPEKQEPDERLNIVGMRAHAAAHSHSHPEGHHECVDVTHPHTHGHMGHSTEDRAAHIRHIVIAQVLEFGIVAHSVIIGIALGVSDSPCTIRPLFAALSFHQFFEGFALGGCISQAGFRNRSAAFMAFFFAITTPIGIAIGMGISTSYNDNSPTALAVQGVFDAISAGILLYMALVDLIAADFLSSRMRCNRQLQVYSYLALFAGSGAMSLLGVWA